MVRLADGDRAAFDPLYTALWPLLQRFAKRLLGETPEADDVAQVALLKIFAAAASFDGERDAVAWALGIAAYECKTVRKQRLRRRESHASHASQESHASHETHESHASHALSSQSHLRDPEDTVIARDLEAAALSVLSTLSAVDIATLRAAVFDDRPPNAGSTFRKRLSRAVARLRVAWSAKYDQD